MPNKLESPVGRLMLTMCTQTTFSLLLYQAYSLTDTFFIAGGVGAMASGAIGIFSPVLTLINGVSSTLGTGGGSLISRRLGEGDASKCRAVAGCMMFVWLVCSLAITAAGLIFLEPLLYILGCTPEIHPYALDYGRIMLLGTAVSTGFSGIMRAQGDIGYSTIQWSCPVIINLVLDPIFIYWLHMGIAGAALATLIAQIFSAASSAYYFFFRRSTPCHIGPKDIRWDMQIFKEMASVGLPAFLGSLGGSMVGVLGNQILGIVGGAGAISAFAIVNRLHSFAATPFSGVMQGIQPMLGFDSGRGEKARVRRTMKLALTFVLAYGITAAVVIALGAGPLMGVFTGNKQTLSAGIGALRILCWALIPGGVMPVVQAYLQAMGHGKRVLLTSLGSVFLIRMPMLLMARLPGTLTGVWWAMAVTDWLIALWAIYHYKKERAKT